MISRNFVRRLVALLAAATLSACIANAPVVDRHATSALAQDKAIVIVSVSHDRTASGAAARFYIDGGSPEASKISSGSVRLEFPIVKNHFRDKYGHVYVLELPPGHHRFTAWSAQWRNQHINLVEGLVPLEFDAVAGDVVYIGNLHVGWLMGKTLFGKLVPSAGMVTVNNNSSADLAIAERDTPAIAGRARVALLPLGPWGRESPSIPVQEGEWSEGN